MQRNRIDKAIPTRILSQNINIIIIIRNILSTKSNDKLLEHNSISNGISMIRTPGGEERCIQDFGGETSGKKTTLKTYA
jgi:hypothetical protein